MLDESKQYEPSSCDAARTIMEGSEFEKAAIAVNRAEMAAAAGSVEVQCD
jgi:hypothetical protein